MTDHDRAEQRSNRRNWLARAAALGLLGPAGISGLIQDALAKGDVPTARGIHSFTGNVTVNGSPAKVGMLVKPGDRVATGPGANATVIIGKDAYLLRADTSVVFEGAKDDAGLLDTVLVTTGKVLSVFGKRGSKERVRVRALNATIGIRGTGCYLEVEGKRVYLCLCYGEAAITGPGMDVPTVITTTHHESPLWLDESGTSMKMEKAGLISHTDDELIMLEKLQGREPPFVALGLTGRY